MDAAIGPNRLPVDPVAGRAGEERDDLGNVVRRSQAFERSRLRETRDGLLVFALEKHVRGRRAGSDGVDVDVATTQLQARMNVMAATAPLLAA